MPISGGYYYPGINSLPVEAATASTGGGTSATTEALTIPIDFEDAGSVDPPADAIFTDQAAVDAALAGAAAFKHLRLAYNALPSIIAHRVVFSLAAGVHRPDASAPTSCAWDLSERLVTPSGGVSIVGTSPADWTPIVTSLTASAHQAGSRNPYLDFSGTPFSGLSLKGRYVVLSTGQTAMIHDHTNSRLRVIQQLSPAPTDGVTTAYIASPNSILRNATVDVNTAQQNRNVVLSVFIIS